MSPEGLMFDLAKAIYAEDLATAREALDQMRREGNHATTIMRARAAVHPLAPVPDVRAFLLPCTEEEATRRLGNPGFRAVPGHRYSLA